MSIYAIIYICFSMVGVGVAIAKHGEPKDSEHNGVHSIIATALVMTLLYLGGFFK